MSNFVYSDGGRSKYFKAANVRDCVVRAICNASGKDYKEVYEGIRTISKQTPRNGVRKKDLKRYIEGVLGWEWHPLMDIGTGCQVHARKEELPKGIAILSMSGHLSCSKDGILYDTYDCSRGGTRCVYGYWSSK